MVLQQVSRTLTGEFINESENGLPLQRASDAKVPGDDSPQDGVFACRVAASPHQDAARLRPATFLRSTTKRTSWRRRLEQVRRSHKKNLEVSLEPSWKYNMA